MPKKKTLEEFLKGTGVSVDQVRPKTTQTNPAASFVNKSLLGKANAKLDQARANFAQTRVNDLTSNRAGTGTGLGVGTDKRNELYLKGASNSVKKAKAEVKSAKETELSKRRKQRTQARIENMGESNTGLGVGTSRKNNAQLFAANKRVEQEQVKQGKIPTVELVRNPFLAASVAEDKVLSGAGRLGKDVYEASPLSWFRGKEYYENQLEETKNAETPERPDKLTGLEGKFIKAMDQWGLSLAKTFNNLLAKPVAKLVGDEESPLQYAVDTLEAKTKADEAKYAKNLENATELRKTIDQWTTSALAFLPDLLASKSSITKIFGRGDVALADNALRLSGREFADAGRAMSKFASKAPAVFKSTDSAYTAVRAMAENPFFWTSFGHVAGDSYDEAKDKGASDWGAYMYALTNGIMNAAIETRGVQENILEESAQPLVDQIWNAVGDEGMEEFVQRKVEKALQNLILGADNPFFSLDDPNAIINPGEDLMATLGGMWGGLVLGGGNSAIQSGINAVNERAIGDSLSEPERNQLIAHAAQMPAYSQSRAEMLKLVPKLTEGTERLTPAEIGKLYNAVAADTAMGITPDRYNDGVVYQQNEDGSYELVNRIGRVAETLQSKGMGVSEAATDAQIINDLLSGNDVKNRQLKDNIVKNETAREVFAELTGIELPAMETTTVSGMAEQIRANAKLFRARQQAEREAVYAERQAQAAQAQEAAVEAAQTQAAVKAESDQIMNDAITQALNESEQGQPEQGQQNQRRQSYDEWYAEKEARIRALGHELDANQKKELRKEWYAQTESDGVRLDNGEVIGRKEFTNIWKQWVKFKEGVTLSAKQLEADYQKYRLGSDDKPMSSELWNQMLAAAGETPGTRAQAQEATGAETQTATEEAAPVEEAPVEEAPVEEAPVEEAPKEKAAKPARKPRAQKPKAESKKPNTRSKSKTEAKPKTERKTTKKPRPKPTETPKGQSKIGEDYWDSLLTETPPPARQRNSIPVGVAENAAEKGIETNKAVSLEQAVTALTLQPFLKSKGINNIKFDAEHLGNAKGSWDELSGVLRLNERKATSADAMAKVIGHEIFHPATAESRRQTGDENDSVAEDFLAEMTRLAQSGRLGGRAGAEITALLSNLDETLAAYKDAYFKHYKSLGLSDLVAGYKTRDALMREEIACDVMGYAFTSPRILDRMAGVRPDLLTRVVQVVQDIRQKARPEMLTINNIGMFGREDAAMNTIIDRVGKALTDSANRRTNVPEGFEEDNEATDNEAPSAEQYALTVFGSGNDQYVVNTDEVKRLHQESVDAGDERRAAYFQSILNNDPDTTREILKQYAEDAGFSTLDVYHGVGGFDSDFIRGFSDRNTESRTRKFFTTPQLNAGAHYAATRGEGWPVDYGKYPLVYRTIQSGQLIHNAAKAGTGRTYVSRLSPSRLVAFANLIPGAVFETDTSSSYKYVSDERKANLPTEFAERTSELYDTLSEIRDDVEDDPYIADDEYMRESFNTFMNFLDGLQAHANGDKRWTPERLRSMAAEAYDAYLDLNQLDEYEEGEIDEEPSEALLSFWRALGDEEVFDTLEEAAVMFDKVLDPSATNIFSEDYRTWFSHRQVMARLKSAQMRGVYHLYGRLGDNPLVFDAEEADWNRLTIDQYDRDTYPGEGTTDALVEWADGAGHTSVVIENLYDGGGMVGDPAALMTDYVFLKSQDVKSADLVTFDDNLRIIPPDERFSDSKNWRLSIEVPVEGLYNQSERVVAGLPDGKIGVGQLLRKLQGGGVNADELKWLGINDFVQGKKSVDKQELLDYIRANDLRVMETILRENPTVTGTEFVDEIGTIYESLEDARNWLKWYLVDAENTPEEEVERYLKIDHDKNQLYWEEDGTREPMSQLKKVAKPNMPGEKETRWESRVQGWTTRGGDNYRELLFQLPGSAYSNPMSELHWEGNAPGTVAHARVQDFTDVLGRDIIFIDEIQSDWHNEGKKYGYHPREREPSPAQDEVENELWRFLADEGARLYDMVLSEDNDVDELSRLSSLRRASPDDYEDEIDGFTEYEKNLLTSALNLYDARGESQKADAAPFADSYVNFVLKNLVRDAAEQGMDGIAWTTGQMQVDRWSEKYRQAYENEYDREIPKDLTRLGKKFGAKVGRTQLDTGRGLITVPFFPITEEMRQSVLENGLPKFAVEVPLKEQIDAAMDGNMPRNHYVYFGTTTPLMQKLGFQKRNEPILMRPSKMRRASMPKTVYDDGAHGITPEQFEMIPYYLEHPVLVIDTMSNRTGADGRPTRENNVLFYTDMFDADGQPLVIAITAYSNYADVTWMGAANESNEKYANIIRTVFGEGPANSQMPEAVKYGPGTRGDSRTGRSFESVVQRAMNSDSLLYVSSEGVKNLLDKAKAWKQEMNQPAPAEGTSPANAFRPKDWLPTPRETWDNWIKFPKGFDKVPKDVVIHKSRNISKPAAQTTKQPPATQKPATQKPATQKPTTQKTAMQLALEKAFQQTQPAPAPKATSERNAIDVDVPGFDEYMREMAAYAEARMRNTSRAPVATGASRTPAQEQMPTGSGAASRGFVRNNTYDTAEQYAQQLEDYGAMPTRDNLYRDLPVPQRTASNNRVSQTAQSAMDSENITNQALKRLHTAVANGDMSYAPITDRASQTRAEAEITEKGWDRALADWTASIRSGKVTKDNTTMGLVLYNSALAANQPQLAVDILVDLSENVRSGAQAVQAMSMLDKLTPEGRFFGMQRSLQNLKQELRDSLGDRAPNIHFNQRLLKDYLRAKTDEERNRIMDKIYQDLAQQIPPTWVDKLNAWRYMAMLANPRTHIRNMVGNAGFTPIRGAKNVVAAGLEAAFIGKGKGRTKALAPHVGKHYASSADQARYQAALNEWGEVENLIQSGGKFQSPMNRIRDAQQVFGTNNDVISKTLGKGAEALRKFNSGALDVEDVWFSKPAYASSLTQYLKANGITAEQYNSPDFDKTKAREYAIKEAQKATYRDYNKFSDFISGLGKTNSKVANTFIEAVLPFKRTPANILVRGIEYSPIGLAKGIWDATYGVKNGEKTAAEAIDAIASGLTGTGLMALGYLLAHLGLLTGGAPKKDKEKAMAKLTGHQNYALEIGDGSYTLDWLAPEALPMFVGAELYKSLADGLKGGDELFEPLKRISDPVLEMSMLQSIDDILDTVSYSDSKLGAILASAATSYLSQYVPTFGGQVERTIEDKRYQTYTDKNSPIPTDVQYALAKAMNKVPFGKKADYAQIEYVDEWGRTYNTGPNGFARAFMNFISPGYASHIEETSVDKELTRLYEATGEGGILPGKAQKSLKINDEDTPLTAEQYEKYAKTIGQTRFKLLDEAFKTDRYKNLPETEKVSFINDVYTYANALGAKEIDPEHKLDRWIVDAGTARQDFNVSTADYILLKEKYGTNYLSGDSVHEKAVTAYKGGIPLETYLRVRSSYDKYDANDSGQLDQKELKAALNATELSPQQKAVMFSLYNKSWKSNPFR